MSGFFKWLKKCKVFYKKKKRIWEIIFPGGGGKDDDGVPLPPILVKIYDAKEPDQKVQTEMDKLEKERGEYEKKMFTMVIFFIKI